MDNKKYCIGFDIATGCSYIAYLENGEPKIINAKDGNRYIPSIVAYTKNGEWLIGNAAKRQASVNPKNTVYEIKRIIGLTYDEAKEDIDSFPYEVRNKNGYPIIIINDKEFTPQEISSKIISEQKRAAEEFLNTEITDVVITIPARFNDSQRTATYQSAEIAGLNVLRMIIEPTAAILATYKNIKQEKKYCVIDIGQGTCDISIIESDGNGIFETITSFGSTHCGGKDVDDAIINWAMSEFKKEHNIDLSKDSIAIQRLKEASEKAKCELSTLTQTELNLPFISANSDGPIHLQMTLTRANMENIAYKFFDKITECLKDTEKKINGWNNVDEVLIVGGSSRIPKFENIVSNITNKNITKSNDPDGAIALGAAIQAGVLMGDKQSSDILLIERLPITIGVETENDLFIPMIEADTTYPTKRSEIFSTASDNQPAVTIHILQGERKIASANKSLGRFDLDGLPPAPRGIPKIEVTFDLDANGLLKVSAKDTATQKQQHVTITGSSQLTKEEIERMKAEAKEHEAEDKKKKEEIEFINQTESYINQIKKTIKDNNDKLDSKDKLLLEDEITNIETAIKEKNIELVKSTKYLLENHWNIIVGKLYDNSNVTEEVQDVSKKQPQQQEKKQDEKNVVDAVFEDVTDNNN